MARILSGIVLILISLLAVLFAPRILYIAGIGIVGTLCLYEFSRIMHAMDIRSRSWFLYAIFWALLAGLYLETLPPLVMMSLATVAALISALGLRKLEVRQRAFILLAELFGIFYITLFLYPAFPIRYSFGEALGRQWTLLMLLVIWVGDTFALVAGRKIGRRPFAPVLSPKKTREGALCGLLSGIIAAVALHGYLFEDIPLHHVFISSAILGIFGQLGDLAESMLKRAAGIKDSSNLIPGHGGVLDRMDSLLLAIPVLYAYLLLVYA